MACTYNTVYSTMTASKQDTCRNEIKLFIYGYGLGNDMASTSIQRENGRVLCQSLNIMTRNGVLLQRKG